MLLLSSPMTDWITYKCVPFDCVCVRTCVCLFVHMQIIQLLFAIENRMCVCLCMFVFWSANWNWTSVWCSLFILSPHSALFNCTTIWWTIRLAKITNKQTFTPHYFFRLANTSSSVENTHTLRCAPLHSIRLRLHSFSATTSRVRLSLLCVTLIRLRL